MSASHPYHGIAAYYDLEHQSFTDDIELYLQFIEAAGDPVLEFGTGTGRILRQIAAAGFDATGIDSSAAMLAFAQQTIDRDSFDGSIALIEGDFQQSELVPSGAFGVVIIALDSLLHATTVEGQLAALRNAWAALDPRGQLIIDVVHPTPARLLAMDGGLTISGSWSLPDGGRLDKLVSQTADPGSQLIENEIWYEKTSLEGDVRRTRTSFTQRWLSASELVLLLQLAGFQDWRVYGSYELDPLDAHSDRIIVAAEKTRTD